MTSNPSVLVRAPVPKTQTYTSHYIIHEWPLKIKFTISSNDDTYVHKSKW